MFYSVNWELLDINTGWKKKIDGYSAMMRIGDESFSFYGDGNGLEDSSITWESIFKIEGLQDYIGIGGYAGGSNRDCRFYFATDAYLLWDESSNWMQVQNANGYIQLGPANSSWAHIYTDRPGFYLNKYLNANSGLQVGADGSIFLNFSSGTTSISGNSYSNVDVFNRIAAAQGVAVVAENDNTDRWGGKSYSYTSGSTTVCRILNTHGDTLPYDWHWLQK